MTRAGRAGLGRQFAGHDERSRGYGVRPLLAARVARKDTYWPLPAGPFPLDQGAEGACHTGDVLIRMADGSHRPIENVRVLDRVATAEGRTGLVLAVMARQADAGIVQVVIRGHQRLRCTPNHPVLTQRGYVRADELTKGDRVAVTRYLPVDDSIIVPGDLVDVSELRGVIDGRVNTGGVISDVARLPELLGKTPDLGRLIGLYAAEGCTSVNRVAWSFGAHEEHTLVAETIALVKSALDATARIQRRPNNAINVVLYGKTWRRLFSALVPGTAKHGDKHLSEHVTHGPREFLAALYDGWQAGDGHARRTEHATVTVSHRLALDMHGIANGLGRLPSLRRDPASINRYARTRRDRHTVVIPTGGGSNASSRQDDSAVWRTVQGVEPEPYEGFVFNMTVQGDESYIADGVGVHNCSGFGMAHELAAGPVQIPGVTNAYALQRYERNRAVDRSLGNVFPDGATTLATMKAAQADGLISGYRWCFGIDDVMDALCSVGPVCLGIEWRDGMYETSKVGLVAVNGPIVGGHFITAVGYQNHPVFGAGVWWLNSWGPSYGIAHKQLNASGGAGFIRATTLASILSRDGEAVIPADFLPTGPTPTPSPAKPTPVPWWRRKWRALADEWRDLRD